jgi:hypothetical protein
MTRLTAAGRISRASKPGRDWVFEPPIEVLPPELKFPPFRGRFTAWDSSRALRWFACAVGSNSRDSSSGLRPDRTNSTICRRNSGGYALLLFDIVDSSFPKDEVSTKRGQLQASPAGMAAAAA